MHKPLNPSPLPLVNGVGPSRLVLPVSLQAGQLLPYLAQRFAHVPLMEWQRRLQSGLVFDAYGKPLDVAATLPIGTSIFYYRNSSYYPQDLTKTATRLCADLPQILYSDTHILIADKPHGWPVNPSGACVEHSLLVYLRKHTDNAELTPMHRIDQDTAGLVLFSLKASERDAYQAMFRQQKIQKNYHAIAPWHENLHLPILRSSYLIRNPQHFLQQIEQPCPESAQGSIQPAISRISLLALRSPYAKYLLEPLTGKRHQLRVHMAALGLPLVGDGIYPQILPAGQASPHYPLRLLAFSLAFTDPISGKAQYFQTNRKLQWPDDASPLVADEFSSTKLSHSTTK